MKKPSKLYTCYGKCYCDYTLNVSTLKFMCDNYNIHGSMGLPLSYFGILKFKIHCFFIVQVRNS